jgi:folate-binding protein YgfZ
MNGDPESIPGYLPALEGAAFFHQKEAGFLRISGKHQADFLQRQTTNDLRLLAPQQALLTVLTSPTARILDVLRLILQGEGPAGSESAWIGAITLPGRAANTLRFFKSRIFFNDVVSVEDISSEYAQLDLLGPKAPSILAGFEITAPQDRNEISVGKIQGKSVQVLGYDPVFSLGFRLLAPVEILDALKVQLEEAGAVEISQEAAEILRVEHGLPAAGRELVEEYTPLETNLAHAISDNKGCYTGQEIIARQITYDKVTQRLSGLRLKEMAQPGESLWVNGKPAGTLTSAVVSPRFGLVGLGILRRPYHEPGTEVQIGKAKEEQAAATVTSLPFGP